MNKQEVAILLIIFTILFNGCMSIPELHNVNQEFSFQEEKNTGVIFGWLSYKGNKDIGFDYMRRLWIDIQTFNDPKQKYCFKFGYDNMWGGTIPKLVTGYYFFVELPIGKYKFSAFPVLFGNPGEMDVRFSIHPNKYTYIGHLQIQAIKYTLEVGGLPLFKNGLQYELSISDKRNEALEELKLQHPLINLTDVQFNLMENYTSVDEAKR